MGGGRRRRRRRVRPTAAWRASQKASRGAVACHLAPCRVSKTPQWSGHALHARLAEGLRGAHAHPYSRPHCRSGCLEVLTGRGLASFSWAVQAGLGMRLAKGAVPRGAPPRARRPWPPRDNVRPGTGARGRDAVHVRKPPLRNVSRALLKLGPDGKQADVGQHAPRLGRGRADVGVLFSRPAHAGMAGPGPSVHCQQYLT